jgi:hypothetical protein
VPKKIDQCKGAKGDKEKEEDQAKEENKKSL